MKYLLALLCLAGCSSTGPQIDLLYGSRDFESSEQWEQTDDQNDVVGMQVDFCGPNGFGPEFGLTYSRTVSADPIYVNRSVYDTTTTVGELFLGMRKSYMVNDWLQLMASGGVSAFSVDTAVNLDYAGTPTDSDIAFAPYVQGGGRVFLNERFTVGVLYRQHFLDEEADIFVTNPELDNGMWLLMIGASF